MTGREDINIIMHSTHKRVQAHKHTRRR